MELLRAPNTIFLDEWLHGQENRMGLVQDQVHLKKAVEKVAVGSTSLSPSRHDR